MVKEWMTRLKNEGTALMVLLNKRYRLLENEAFDLVPANEDYALRLRDLAIDIKAFHDFLRAEPETRFQGIMAGLYLNPLNGMISPLITSDPVEQLVAVEMMLFAALAPPAAAIVFAGMGGVSFVEGFCEVRESELQLAEVEKTKDPAKIKVAKEKVVRAYEKMFGGLSQTLLAIIPEVSPPLLGNFFPLIV